MNTAHELVFEIGTEELPALALDRIVEVLAVLGKDGLDSVHLPYETLETFGTPRRVVLMIHGLADETARQEQHFRGPAASLAFDPAGNLTKAAQGFAKSKAASVDELVLRDQDGKSYVWIDRLTPSRPAAEVLVEVLQQCAEKINDRLSGLRTQRWGTTSWRFSRPVRWLVCLLDEDVLPVQFCGLIAGRTTRGHRLMNPGDYDISDASSYEDTLRDIHVIARAQERARIIRDEIALFESDMNLCASTPKKIFDEVVNLVEWPTVLVADFDEEFLEVPAEILCDTMLSNQKYFPLTDAEGHLSKHFIVVSNGDPAYSAQIASGNERVVRARLSDAKFFYEEDLKQPLEAYVERLAEVGFQEKLGSVLDKTHRMTALVTHVAQDSSYPSSVVSKAARAALLAKADLVCSAVIEFTSQQGIMGGYYALASGEDPDVARAIAQHYCPRFAGDVLPDGPVGRLVAFADKLDTTCSIFAIDEAPTGSSDPYAVRRSAIGIINIVRAEPQISLERAIDYALEELVKQGISFDMDAVRAAVCDFFVARLVVIAREEGARPDTIEAVRAVRVIEPQEFLARTSALEEARKLSPEVFDDLASAYTRANNLRDPLLGTDVDTAHLGPADIDLARAVESAQDTVTQALAGPGGYAKAIEALAGLRGPIDTFFNTVMVMDEDPQVRANRLKLLNRFVEVFHDVADIGKMEKKSSRTS